MRVGGCCDSLVLNELRELRELGELRQGLSFELFLLGLLSPPPNQTVHFFEEIFSTNI